MVAVAVFVTAVQLVQTVLTDTGGLDPWAVGAAFWPMPVGLVLAAGAFGALFRTRLVPVLVNVGLLALTGATLVLLLARPERPGAATLGATFLLGFGAGATVSPGLFLAALGVASDKIGRAFALVELLRSISGYAVAPVVVAVVAASATPRAGLTTGLWIVLVLALVGLLASLLVPALSGARLRRPDLEAWLDDGEQALDSPTTAVHLRPGVEDDVAEPLLPVRRHR
jgi:MFS family permease